MSRLMLGLLFGIAHANAIECNVTYAGIPIDVASDGVCSFTVYHADMLMLFGSFTVCLLFGACLSALCGAGSSTIRPLLSVSVISFILSLGFETLALSMLILGKFDIYTAITRCMEGSRPPHEQVSTVKVMPTNTTQCPPTSQC
jgi:hypothetical protein